MAFKPLSIATKNRRITAITNFSGVDYATQRFKVSQNRAIDILNFIYKDGVIQKRRGIEELFHVENTHYIPVDFVKGILETDVYSENTTNFNGIWSFVGEDKKEHLVAHIGKLLYEIKNIGQHNMSISPIRFGTNIVIFEGNTYVYAYEFLDYKSSAFVGANKLYFLGGNKYMCLRFLDGAPLLSPVENGVNTYVPTTTISITYEGSAFANRASLDKVNMLSKLRKNELLSGTQKVDNAIVTSKNFEYILDAPIVSETKQDLADILIVLEEGGTI
ncbi:MAG: hypothetical protein M0Q41_10735 [Bacteroidales bacterium]|nr:hypothetical protein [Acholeplasmataceae bacterium]MCK9449437.1 hypothetical protein [Bacteroidales bacterium]